VSFEEITRAHAASYSIGTGGSFMRVKRPGRDVDHSSLSSAEVKNECSYVLPRMYLRGVNRDNFYFSYGELKTEN
jgi:hypothetical protein